MKKLIALLTLACLGFLPLAAQAEVQPGSAFVSLGGGYLFFAPKRNLRNTVMPAYVAAGYNFNECWAMQFAANLVNATSHNPNNQFVHGFLYLFDEMYRLKTWHKIDPYVMAGLNVFSLKPVTNQAVNQGGLNLGLGAQFFKSSHIAVVAEGRDVYTFSGGKNDFLLNLGFNFIWE